MTLSSNARGRGFDVGLVVLSLAAHGALAALLGLAPPRPPRAERAPDAVEITLELDRTQVTPPGSLRAPLLPELHGTAERAPVRREQTIEARQAVEPKRTPSDSAGSPAEAAEPLPPPPVAGQAPIARARALTLADLGVGKNPFVGGLGPGGPLAAAGPSAPGVDGRDPSDTTRAANERVQDALRADARAREAELGLGPDGPVRAALSEAMYASGSPVIARVVFDVRADGQGRVLSVEAVSADTSLTAFRGVESRAKSALARSPLRLPSTARGASLRVEVTSAWKLPSGHDPGASVEVFGKTVHKGEGKQSTKVVVLDPIPKVRCISPDDPKNDLKLPLCTVGVVLFGTDVDPADLGAKPRRIVHTRVLESRIL